MSDDNEKYGTSHRKILDSFDDSAELFGYSKIGLLIVFSPALFMWVLTNFRLDPSLQPFGVAAIVFFALVGIVTIVATPDDESLLGFVGKYVKYYSNQKVYIHEEQKYSDSNDKNSDDDHSWGF